MNWIRAKNILIVTFIIIDLLLLGNVVYSYGPAESIKRNREQEQTLNMLKASGITVDAKIPQQTPAMSLLRVEVDNYNSKSIGRILSGGYSEEVSGDEHIYRTLTEIISIAPNGDLNYKSIVPLTFNVSIEEGLLNFLTSKGIAEPGMYIESVEEKDGLHTVKISHQVDGYFLDMSYIKAEIGPRSVKIVKHWLKPAGYLSRKKKVVPAYKALGSFMGSRGGNRSIRITDIELGYFFSWDEAASGEAVPAWRITTDKGIYYFNAYTGVFEG
jgi:regulatory protein YycI of two-component signal transduction system YycFG